jgi:hypothetical protein
MVTTRNRSRNPSLTQAEMELPPPTRPRRTRQTKPRPAIVQDAEESETVESSSPTSSPESRSPPSEAEEPLSPVDVPKEVSPLKTTVLSNKSQQDDDHEDNEEEEEGEEEETQTVPEDEQQSESAESEDEEEEEDDDEDLDALLVKAQASLKRKAMFEDKTNEPMFNFPKLQTGLKDRNVYIKQENGRAKVAVDNVIVVDKSNKSGSKPALETCEVNMNSEKVHVSKRQKQEVRNALHSFAFQCGRFLVSFTFQCSAYVVRPVKM